MPLTVGFLVNENGLAPAWYAATIDAVAQKGHWLYFLTQPEPVAEKRKPLFFRAFEAFETWWFKTGDDAFKPVSLTQWMNESNCFPAGDANALAFDLIYSIHPQNHQAPLLKAKYGFWYVAFGKSNLKEKGPVAFWEVMRNEPVLESRLLVERGGQSHVAYEGSTVAVPYSVRNSFNTLAWKAAAYLPLRLAAVDKLGLSFLLALPVNQQASEGVFYPANGQMAFLFLRNLIRYLRYKLAKPTGRFTLLYAFGRFHLEAFSTASFRPMPLPNTNVFYADPFVMEENNVHYIFFEEMDEAEGRAHISCTVLTEGKEPETPKAVLKKPYHLSYPFVFQHEGSYYMIPETAGNGTVEIYKATRFPYDWEFVMNLMEGVTMIDVTVHYEAGYWWLFAASNTHPLVSTNDQVFLFSSDELFSTTWTPHPLNPIATRAENARPGGRIFRHEGRLYRPAQNNASPQYGYGLTLNVIEVLTESNYREREVLSVAPESLGLKACHHLDFSSSLIVVDGIGK